MFNVTVSFIVSVNYRRIKRRITGTLIQNSLKVTEQLKIKFLPPLRLSTKGIRTLLLAAYT